MRPIHLLKHLTYLNSFTPDEIKNLEFETMKSVTLQRILLFTITVYQKYFTKNYQNMVEKNNI